MSISKRLQEERNRLRLTQGQASKKAGILARSWNQYENDKAMPSCSNLQALQRVGFDVPYILFGLRTPSDHLIELVKFSKKEFEFVPDEQLDGPFEIALSIKYLTEKLLKVYKEQEKQSDET